MRKRTVVRATTLTGVVGETNAEEALESLGWATSGACRFGRAKDLVAEHVLTGTSIEVSVKSTTTGAICFKSPGSSLDSWIDAASQDGMTAVVVMVALQAPARMSRVAGSSGLWLVKDPVLTLTALTAQQFAAKVDLERADYASRPYLIGDRKGEAKSADNLQYPVLASEGRPLADLLDELVSGRLS